MMRLASLRGIRRLHGAGLTGIQVGVEECLRVKVQVRVGDQVFRQVIPFRGIGKGVVGQIGHAGECGCKLQTTVSISHDMMGPRPRLAFCKAASAPGCERRSCRRMKVLIESLTMLKSTSRNPVSR